MVVGGGGGGIIAAWQAAVRGCPVLLLERNGRLGTKILISGGGKCNVTHAGSLDDILAGFVLHEQRFLKSAFHSFSNTDIQRLLEDRGLPLEDRPDGRMFPAYGNAKDVVRNLASLLHDQHVTIRFHHRVEEICSDQHRVSGVRVGEKVIPASCVILATGGSSYPQTGTTGDGYGLARTLGHTIVPLRAALAPMGIAPALPREWRGVAIRNACLSAQQSGRRMAAWNGDLLITHEGLSGPAALEVSRAAAVAAAAGPVALIVDFLPDMAREATDHALLSMINTQGSRMISTLLEPWLPNRMIEGMLRSAGVDPTTRGHALTRENRRMVIDMLKGWKIGTVASIRMERGEVTAGGVALNEVDPRTMRSRRIKGLYFCGEVLDIAGSVGGYNLQAAFSTGYVAGASAAGEYLAGS